MEGFQKTVLIIAIIILIITLIIIGMALSKKSAEIGWPPMVPQCPDYWTIDGSGNNTTCINVKDLGTCKSVGSKHKTMNFNTSEFTGAQGTCNKYTWANNCNISWDGITYGVINPCQQ